MDVGKSQRVPPFSFFGIVRFSPENKNKKFFFFNFFMFCDRMDVEKPQRVPPFSFSALWDVSPGAPLGPFFWYVIFSKKKSKNFRFSTSVNEYLTLGSLFAIFEPWIWRRLEPVPACLVFYRQKWDTLRDVYTKHNFFNVSKWSLPKWWERF